MIGFLLLATLPCIIVLNIFNTFAAKMVNMYLSLLLGFFLFLKFLKYWKLMHIKNLIFNTTAKLKYRELCYFGQTVKLKYHEM